mmetsp:Transcript_9011/g.20297  ORF Transcript_9011/g.20297 Transcript_9011/m.20297 type:complete len:521 (+) Transcript_9011:249-1811(+)
MSLFMYRKQSQANLEKFNNPPAATTSSDPFPKDGPSTAGRADQRLESMLERRRREKHLDKIVGVMEKQQKELDAALAEAEIAEKAARLRMGNKASDMLIKAEERARDLGHRAVGTGDILWAMFHDAEEDRQSTAISFLKGRGVTRESVYASHRYSDNAARIVKLAAQRSSDLNKRVVGTEDLLWAMFQTDDHTHSRSFAVKRLEARGVNMELVWNQAELSPNARKALTVAVKQAKNKGQRIIETEHLMEALFAAELESGDINRLSHARHWMTTQHLPLAPSVRRRDSEALGGVGSEELEESIPRMFVVGGLAGVVETFLVQPLVFFKTMAQVSPEGLFSARNLRLDVMYRGVYVNALSIGPISAFQYGCNGILTSVHREAKRVFNESDPGSAAAVVPKETATEGMAIAALTGTLSSLVVTPAELLMISQQRSGKSFTKTLLEVLWPQARAKEGGGKLPGAGLLRGLGPTAAREAVRDGKGLVECRTEKNRSGARGQKERCRALGKDRRASKSPPTPPWCH